MSRATPILLAALLILGGPASASELPSLVLLTLDATRSDHLGAYGASDAKTPVLDALAGRGVRFSRAVVASPQTLPSHASLLTGLDPPEHGVRDNGATALPESVPTLATVLSSRRYATGAFVASRVLDRRSGLDRGFDTYDDGMAGAERDARAVTAAAIDWLSRLPAGKPYFLWVHYNDPHAPYAPPAAWRGGSTASDYAGEIAYVDQQIGRLLAALPADEALIAAVGDHGEMLGEHGERGHGIFLYRAALEVPLILAGPGVPAGRVIGGTVAARYLAATLLRLLGAHQESRTWGSRLSFSSTPVPKPIYSETRMGASAYGWAPLKSVSADRWRLIAAPRPELYDVVADPGEQRNRYAERRDEVRSLEAILTVLESRFKRHETEQAPADSRLERAIDPKDGIELLADYERAERLIAAGKHEEALPLLEKLVGSNPGNEWALPWLLWGKVAEAQGNTGDAIERYRRVVALAPQSAAGHEARRRLESL